MKPKEAQELLPFAKSDKQNKALNAVISTTNMGEAAVVYGTQPRTLRDMLYTIKAQASLKGHAPGHFESGIAEGY